MPNDLIQTSYVKDSILDHLEELAEEVEQLEFEDRRVEGEDRADDVAHLKALIRETFAIVDQIIRAKTRWLDRSKIRGPLFSTHAPAWYLEFQQEFVTLRFAQQWAQQLDNVLPRLMALPSLALAKRPATECRVCLEEAARCFLQGLFRPAAVLARASLEAALKDRLQSHTETVVPMARDRLRQLLETAERFGLLRGKTLAAARDAKRIGDDAAHGRQATEVGASHALRSVRTVLETLYDGEPEPEGTWWSDTQKAKSSSARPA